MENTKKDSYWYLKDEKMVAICTKCHDSIQEGTFWSAKQGYGNFDILCNSCKDIINTKEIND